MPRTTSRWALTLAACIAGAAGCGQGGGGGKASARASGEASASAPLPSASASAPPVSDEPEGTGFSTVVDVGKPEAGCAPATFELAQNLLRGELTLAGRAGADGSGEIAASWLIQLQARAQIGFAGFDGQARRLARDRGIGNAREDAPRLFATGDAWTVVWFDAEGLAFARPRWEAQPPPEIGHLSAVKDVKPADMAFAATPEGPLVVASPFGTQGDQLTLFLFAPVAEGQKARALGVTKIAKKPRSPAVSADASGYTVAWLEEDGHVKAARFDSAGKELGLGGVAVQRPADRSSLAIAAVEGGALLAWVEGETIFVRALGPDARPISPVFVVGKGKHPQLVSSGADAVIAFLAEAGGTADQLLAVRVSAKGPSQAVRVNENKLPVLNPPAVAVAGPRLAFAWTEIMSPTMVARRAWLRTIAAACVK
jgi:hypothetical protein